MVTRIVFIKGVVWGYSGMMLHVILWLMGLNLRDIMPCVKALTLEWTIPIFYTYHPIISSEALPEPGYDPGTVPDNDPALFLQIKIFIIFSFSISCVETCYSTF